MKTEFFYRALLAGIAVAIFIGPSGQGAALVLDRTDFNAQVAAIPNVQQENFDFSGLTTGWRDTGTVFPGTSVSLTASATGGLWLWTNPDYTLWLGSYNSRTDLTLSFGGANVVAVGGEFFLTDLNNLSLSGTFSVTLSDSTTHVVSSLGPGNPQPFAGFISSAPAYITSLTLHGISSPAPLAYTSFDNLAVATVVPEPMEAGLVVAGGLVALAGWRCHGRRRRGARVV
jgi:hypothetical protein